MSRRLWSLAFCLLSAVLGGAAPAWAQLKDENLLVALPQGFSVVMNESRNENLPQ